MKKIRNLTITFLSFIIMLCIAIGLSLCFPAQESSVLAETSTQKTLNARAADYESLVFKGTNTKFNISGWAYGEPGDNDLTAPEFTGDGQVSHFSLIYNGVTITKDEKGDLGNALIGDYGYYVHRSMPVGTYILNLRVAYNSGAVSDFVQVATFKVNNRAVDASSKDYYAGAVAALNGIIRQREYKKYINYVTGIGNPCPYLIDEIKNLPAYATFTDNNTANLFGVSLENAFYLDPKDTYWGEDSTKYFNLPQLMISDTEWRANNGTAAAPGSGNWYLVTWRDNTYWNNISQAGTFADAGEHRVGYCFKANCYDIPDGMTMPTNGGTIGDNGFYFTIKAYHVFTAPTVSELTWLGTGVSLRTQIESQIRNNDDTFFSKFNVLWTNNEAYSDAKTYYIDLSLNNAPSSHRRDSDKYCLWYEENKPIPDDDKTDVRVVVKPAVNEWVVQPTIPTWVKGNVSENFYINAYPKYSDTGMLATFIVKEANTEEEKFRFFLDYSAFGGLLSFSKEVKIGEDSTTTPATLFRQLGVGEYELTVEFTGTDNIVSTTDFINNSVGTFSVKKATKQWQSDPYIKSWTWDEYDDVNVLSAAVVNQENVVFKVEFSEATAEAIKLTLYLQGDKYYTDEDRDTSYTGKFEEFTAGKYKATVTVKETADYYELSTDVYFSVLIADNSWSVSPRIAGWTYGSANNYLEGTPRHEGSGYTYKIDNNPVAPEKFLEELDKLGADDHTVTITVVGESNKYGDLTAEIKFRVEPGQYPWKADEEGNSAYVPSLTVANPVYGQRFEIVKPHGTENEYGITITYYNALDQELSGQPENAGNYKAKVELSRKDSNNFAVTELWLDFTISQKQNNWQSENAPVAGTVSQTYDEIALKAPLVAYDNDASNDIYTVTYTVTKQGAAARTVTGNNPWICEKIEEVKATLESNGIGTYTVTFAATTENTNYKNFETVTTYVISMAQNDWKNSYAEVSKTYGENPQLGEFEAKGGRATYTVNGTEYTSIRLLNEAVANRTGFDVGTYTVTVTVPAGNYTALNDRFTLTVTPAPNEVTSITIGEEFEYGERINPTAAVRYGSGAITFHYQKKEGNSWVAVAQPSEVGDYRVTASVAANGNYAAAESAFYEEFNIVRTNATISGLTIGGFQWNGYDKTTFVAATTNSPSAITYAVYSGTSKLFDLGLDANGLPDDESVEAMNGLVAGSYRLVASTAVSTNYNATSTGADAGNFTVTAASNGWVITPNIRSWVHYEFDDEVNMPYAVPQYGSISVTIKNAEGATVYSGTISVTVENGEYVYSHTGNTAGLWNAPGGLYTLTVTVSGENNKYNGLTSSTVFDIFTGSISRPQNYWEEVPSIDSWTSEYQDYTTPAGVPNRWTTVTHKYYEAERTPNGFVSDLTLLATLTRTYVGAGSPDRIEVDGEMPAKPGWYMVVYTSAYEDDNGTVYEADALTYTVYFQILEAENSWVETPNIENWTLNGAASVPTTGSAMYDSEYVITYRPFDEPNAEPVSEIPTTAGRYVMIVTAKAKVDGKPSLYCKDIVSEVVFTVSLATNEWVVLPTLEGWSEEFSDQEHNPVAEAKAGTVTYYYYDSNHKLLEDKPTAAGTYYLVAEVEADGYEKLSSEVEFTITAAWDETLILIDMVLGVAACAATVVAIIFAKRRKSQC